MRTLKFLDVRLNRDAVFKAEMTRSENHVGTFQRMADVGEEKKRSDTQFSLPWSFFKKIASLDLSLASADDRKCHSEVLRIAPYLDLKRFFPIRLRKKEIKRAQNAVKCAVKSCLFSSLLKKMHFNELWILSADK